MTQMKITDQQRDALNEIRRSIDSMLTTLDEIPLTNRTRTHLLSHIEAIDNLSQEIAGAEVHGRCEGCETLLVVGDLVHATEDAGNLCEECAPTNGDVLKQYEQILAQPDDGAASGIDIDDLRERFVLLSAYSPEDLAKKALTELT